MNVRAWIDFLVALLEKPAVVAGVAQVLNEPLPLRIASESESAGCCEYLVTFDKSCCF